MYDYCQKVGADYSEVIKSIKADPRIGKTHWDIFQDGFRGYAGACFPKDMKATGYDSGLPLILLADKLNDEYVQLQKRT
jgi:UDP-glucose 6-dehydrogenase